MISLSMVKTASYIIAFLIEKRRTLWLLRFLIYRRELEIRFSFAAIVRIEKDNRYVLLRNRHRREIFGPLGGVSKYYNTAVAELDKLEVRPQFSVNDQIMRNDLRGFLPAKHLSSLINWFEHTDERENAHECIKREILEELIEIDAPSDLVLSQEAKFQKIRSIYEGPHPVPHKSYLQFRIIEVYHFSNDNHFTDELIRISPNIPDILWTDADAIRHGRTSSGFAISNHSEYLFSKIAQRPEHPPLVLKPSPSNIST